MHKVSKGSCSIGMVRSFKGGKLTGPIILSARKSKQNLLSSFTNWQGVR
jgi:hypothetical protein